jgi:hypothetical protein
MAEFVESALLWNHSPINTTTAATSNQTTDAVYHEPAGQHLLVDFEEVDRSFLQSETRLAQAMIELERQSSISFNAW